MLPYRRFVGRLLEFNPYVRVVRERDALREIVAHHEEYFTAKEEDAEHLERMLEAARDELEEIRDVLGPFDPLTEHETALEHAYNARDIIIADRAIIQQLKQDIERLRSQRVDDKEERYEERHMIEDLVNAILAYNIAHANLDILLDRLLELMQSRIEAQPSVYAKCIERIGVLQQTLDELDLELEIHKAATDEQEAEVQDEQ